MNINQHKGFQSVPLNDDPERGYAEELAQPQPHTYARKSKLGFIPLGPSRNNSVGSFGTSINEKESTAASPQQKQKRRLSSADWETFNSSTSKHKNLQFADGDFGKGAFAKFWLWALNRSFVFRWAIFIIPILAIFWIPGIIWAAGRRDAEVWNVKLLWWSIWLTIAWLGFWAAKLVCMAIPHIYKQTIVVIAPAAGKYTDVVRNLGKYFKYVLWSLAIWIAWNPIIINHCQRYVDGRLETYQDAAKANASLANATLLDNWGDAPETSGWSNISLAGKIIFGVWLCTLIQLAEKLIVQLIAFKFHEDSYADRIDEQKFQVKALTQLYMNSHDIPGRSDTLKDHDTIKTERSQAPKKAVRKALREVKKFAQNTSNAIGTVASEMTGSTTLQTNSPTNKVKAALQSANKSKALARRLFYSYRKPGSDHLVIDDIARFFPDLETAERAFGIFDRDGNGDATRDEIDASLLEIHTERLSLEASMRDLDGAVRRLDDILMCIVTVIWVLIFATMITQKISSLVSSASAALLSLSWVLGPTFQEVLGACIFLFVKHPYDVGDRVDIDTNQYTVVKMELMSSSFRRLDGKFVWIGHDVLRTKVIENIRRSGATSETFTFDVDFQTPFDKLQELRAVMLRFVKDNPRDYLPIFDVMVDDYNGQSKMTLKADIRYKSNWQQGALKVQRRNKWVCELKQALHNLEIWGPLGMGNPDRLLTDRVTMVPYDEYKESLLEQQAPSSPPPSFRAATAGKGLSGRHNEDTNLWGEVTYEDESRGPSRAPSPGPNSAFHIGTPPRVTSPGPSSTFRIGTPPIRGSSHQMPSAPGPAPYTQRRI